MSTQPRQSISSARHLYFEPPAEPGDAPPEEADINAQLLLALEDLVISQREAMSASPMAHSTPAGRKPGIWERLRHRLASMAAVV